MMCCVMVTWVWKEMLCHVMCCVDEIPEAGVCGVEMCCLKRRGESKGCGVV